MNQYFFIGLLILFSLLFSKQSEDFDVHLKNNFKKLITKINQISELIQTNKCNQ
jgi:hypothetical protein